jgi:RNA recognition motif-containing protein
MGKKLYVANLSYGATSADLEALFAPFGVVEAVQVITDPVTRRSKGLAFVEMASEQEAEAAIAGLNGKQVGGRALRVEVAKFKGDRRGGRREPGQPLLHRHLRPAQVHAAPREVVSPCARHRR